MDLVDFNSALSSIEATPTERAGFTKALMPTIMKGAQRNARRQAQGGLLYRAMGGQADPEDNEDTGEITMTYEDQFRPTVEPLDPEAEEHDDSPRALLRAFQGAGRRPGGHRAFAEDQTEWLDRADGKDPNLGGFDPSGFISQGLRNPSGIDPQSANVMLRAFQGEGWKAGAGGRPVTAGGAMYAGPGTDPNAKENKGGPQLELLRQKQAASGFPQRDAAGHFPWYYRNDQERDAIQQGAAAGKNEVQALQELAKSSGGSGNISAPGGLFTAAAAASWLANNPGGTLDQFYSEVLPKQRADRGARPLSLDKAGGPNSLENLRAKAQADNDPDAIRKLQYLADPANRDFAKLMYGDNVMLRAMQGSAGGGKTAEVDAQQVSAAMTEAQRLVDGGMNPTDAQSRVLSRTNAVRRRQGLEPLTLEDVPVFEGGAGKGTKQEDVRDVTNAMQEAQKLVDDGATPEEAQTRVLARMNATRKRAGLTPLTAEDIPVFGKTNDTKARDKTDRGKFLDYIKGGYGPEEAAQLVNAEREEEGLPAKDFSKFHAPNRKDKEQQGSKDKGDFDQAAKLYKEAIAAGVPPEEAKKDAIDAVNAGRRTSGQKELAPEAFVFQEAPVKQKQALEEVQTIQGTVEKVNAYMKENPGAPREAALEAVLPAINANLKRLGRPEIKPEDVAAQMPKKFIDQSPEGVGRYFQERFKKTPGQMVGEIISELNSKDVDKRGFFSRGVMAKLFSGSSASDPSTIRMYKSRVLPRLLQRGVSQNMLETAFRQGMAELSGT